MNASGSIRSLLGIALSWRDAHASFDDAVADIPENLRGVRPSGLPYSAWQIVEHLRIAQEDILDFCRDADYQQRTWPDDYWPLSPAPPSAAAWDESISRFKADRKQLEALAADKSLDLGGTIPHGSGQTYLRELVLVIDHNAYHVGQLVLLRRLLGVWSA